MLSLIPLVISVAEHKQITELKFKEIYNILLKFDKFNKEATINANEILKEGELSEEIVTDNLKKLSKLADEAYEYFLKKDVKQVYSLLAQIIHYSAQANKQTEQICERYREFYVNKNGVLRSVILTE